MISALKEKILKFLPKVGYYISSDSVYDEKSKKKLSEVFGKGDGDSDIPHIKVIGKKATNSFKTFHKNVILIKFDVALADLMPFVDYETNSINSVIFDVYIDVNGKSIYYGSFCNNDPITTQKGFTFMSSESDGYTTILFWSIRTNEISNNINFSYTENNIDFVGFNINKADLKLLMLLEEYSCYYIYHDTIIYKCLSSGDETIGDKIDTSHGPLFSDIENGAITKIQMELISDEDLTFE